MRRFIVHVLISTAAITLTLLLLSRVTVGGVPLLDIPYQTPSGPGRGINIDIGIGLLFALASAILPPVMATLFGRWYLRNPVFAYLLANFALFWLVAQLSAIGESPFLVPEPALLWLFIDSVVFALVVVTLNTLLGLDRPRVEEPSRNRRLWNLLERLPATRRNQLIENIRLWEVYDKFSRFGVEIAITRTPFARLRGIGDRLTGGSSRDIEQMSAQAKVRLMLQQLGPTYVKLGQMLAGRPELLGPEWATELAKLQNTVPPFSWDEAASIIEDELGRPPEKLFASIDHEPLGAASLAQVHRATLADGRSVVVKVQRPGIQAKVRADLGVLVELADIAESRFEMARHAGVRQIVEEFAAGVREELDYTIEAYNAARLEYVLRREPGVGVPAIEVTLSSRRVIVMEYVEGIKPTHIERLDPDVDREVVARTLLRALVRQVLLEGFFHGDPHPGNVLLEPATGKVVFLDLGLMGELGEQERFDILALVWALRTRDPGMMAKVVRRLCRPTGHVDEAAYQRAVERLFYRSWVYGQGSMGGVVSGLFEVLGAHHLRMRRELVMAVKAISQAEELVRAIAPDVPIVETIVDEAQALLANELASADRALQSGLAMSVQEVVQQAATLGPAFIPRLIDLGEAAHSLMGQTSPEERMALILREGVERAGRQVDAQLGRLASSVAWLGIALGTGLGAIAFLSRPSGLEGIDLVIVTVPIATGAVIAWIVRGWRSPESDAAADAGPD
ncbi:MAG: AarF/UbiB family protein [Candidatus Limnocylindrales bacterium]